MALKYNADSITHQEDKRGKDKDFMRLYLKLEVFQTCQDRKLFPLEFSWASGSPRQ